MIESVEYVESDFAFKILTREKICQFKKVTVKLKKIVCSKQFSLNRLVIV